MSIRLLLVLFLTFSSAVFFCLQAQQSTDSLKTDSEKKNLLKKIYEYFEKSNEVDNTKPFDVSFIGGPHYSNDTKLGLGLVASGLYRIDRKDLTISPSNVSLYADLTTSGSYVIGISGNTIFPRDKYRLDFDLFFSSRPSKYWGIGYDKGKHDDDYSKYTRKAVQVKADFLVKIVKNTYFGVTASAQHLKASNIKNPAYFESLKRSNNAIGGGLILSYDSRDFIPNPSKGLYLKIEQNFYPEFLGSTEYFNKTEFTARFYKQVWSTGILAFDFQGIFNNGDTPWNMMAELGSAYQMRGYFKGQYNDKKLLQTQVELRQKVYGRSGVVVWAGAGNVFPKFDEFKFKHTLPTFGVGYRWEFKNRVNVRLDYGIGKGQSSFYFNINEAF